MKVVIDKNIEDTFSGIRFVFFIYSGPLTYKNQNEAEKNAKEITEKVRKKYRDTETISRHYLINLYKVFYEKMNLNIKKISTPLKQASRFLDSDYRNKNIIIDECMKIEYLTGVSFQLYDADKVGDYLRYTIYSKELTLMKDREVIHNPSTGNNPAFSVNDQTKNILIRLMGIPGISDEDWNDAINQISQISFGSIKRVAL